MPEISPVAYWLIIVVVLAIVEIATVNLVSIWFCFGALVTMLLTLLGLPFLWQIVVFIAASSLLLVFTRPIVKKHLGIKKEKTNADMVEGKEGVVLADIDNNNPGGLVKVDGREWTAKSVQNNIIPAGTRVRVLRIEGVKVVVEQLTEKNKENNEKRED